MDFYLTTELSVCSRRRMTRPHTGPYGHMHAAANYKLPAIALHDRHRINGHHLDSVSSPQGGWDKVLGLRNTCTSIIAFQTFQSRLYMLADCAPRPNVHTLSHGRALYCIRAPGMTRTYVAKEPYGGLGLIV